MPDFWFITLINLTDDSHCLSLAKDKVQVEVSDFFSLKCVREASHTSLYIQRLVKHDWYTACTHPHFQMRVQIPPPHTPETTTRESTLLGAPHNPGYESKVRQYEVKLQIMGEKFQEISLSHGETW